MADKLRKFIPSTLQKIAIDMGISSQDIIQAVDFNAIFSKVVEAMSEGYTEDEIDATIAFYDSEIGRSIANKEAIMATQLTEMINEYVMSAIAGHLQKSDSLKN